MQLPLLSHKASRFTESVIRGMSVEAAKYGAVNLAQGMPDFPAPAEVKAAACRAIEADVNQYAITWGAAASARRSPSTPPGTSAWTSTRRPRSPSPAAAPRRCSSPCSR